MNCKVSHKTKCTYQKIYMSYVIGFIITGPVKIFHYHFKSKLQIRTIWRRCSRSGWLTETGSPLWKTHPQETRWHLSAEPIPLGHAGSCSRCTSSTAATPLLPGRKGRAGRKPAGPAWQPGLMGRGGSKPRARLRVGSAGRDLARRLCSSCWRGGCRQPGARTAGTSG